MNDSRCARCWQANTHGVVCPNRPASCWGAGKFPDHTDAIAGRVRCRGCQRWVDSPDGSVPEHSA